MFLAEWIAGAKTSSPHTHIVARSRAHDRHLGSVTPGRSQQGSSGGPVRRRGDGRRRCDRPRRSRTSHTETRSRVDSAIPECRRVRRHLASRHQACDRSRRVMRLPHRRTGHRDRHHLRRGSSGSAQPDRLRRSSRFHTANRRRTEAIAVRSANGVSDDGQGQSSMIVQGSTSSAWLRCRRRTCSAICSPCRCCPEPRRPGASCGLPGCTALLAMSHNA